MASQQKNPACSYIIESSLTLQSADIIAFPIYRVEYNIYSEKNYQLRVSYLQESLYTDADLHRNKDNNFTALVKAFWQSLSQAKVSTYLPTTYCYLLTM